MSRNYVMLELGKPIHTFDAAAVHDGRIVVRRATAGERLETLDHVARELDPETLVIADPQGPIGIAGVMGGATSEVSDATTEVIVESAIFDPISIRRTAFRYALRSEASLRFEKGQESRLARLGADRAARLIAEWAGGEVAPGAVDTNPVEPAAAHVTFRPARVNRLLGTDLGAEEQRALLARVGIATAPAAAGARITVAAGSQPLDVVPDAADVVIDATVPTWRRDLVVEADITEEVIRVHGYDLVPAVTPHTPMPPYRPDPLGTRNAVRETLVGAGLSEVVTFALVAPRIVELFPPHDDGAPDGEPEQRPAGRPITRDQPALEPAFDAPSDAHGEPARGRLDEPPPGSRRHRHLRGRQGVWRTRRSRHARVVASRHRAQRAVAAAGARTVPRLPTTSTTPRVSSSCSVAGSVRATRSSRR